MLEETLTMEGERLMSQVELAKQRCKSVIRRVKSIEGTSKITDACKQTLLRLANSELNFLSTQQPSSPLSVNIGHLEAVIYIIQQPFITGVSRVCKPIPLLAGANDLKGNDSLTKGIYVDVVCTLNGDPVWVIVSDRNPKYVSWLGCYGNKGLKARVEQVVDAARSSSALKPSSIIFFFSHGLDANVQEKLEEEYGASEYVVDFSILSFDFSEEVEGDWVNVLARSFQEATIFQVKVDRFRRTASGIEHGTPDSLIKYVWSKEDQQQICVFGNDFNSVIQGMQIHYLNGNDAESAKFGGLSSEHSLINFDTTALIALVSGISNGSTDKLLAAPENDLRRRFKSNYEFVIGQVNSEIQNPILLELSGVLSRKKGIACESVHMEFKEIVSMCGGPNEKLRSDQLLKCLMIVPDSPSARMMDLPTTRKLALKNKIAFGTGDHWHAPTLTANMAFARAVSQTGMSLSIVEHRPRALVGE